jgi:hypothetical protein
MVVAATCWELPLALDRAGDLDQAFEPLRKPPPVGTFSLAIEESKSLFQPGAADGRAKLHALVSASLNWCGLGAREIGELVSLLSPWDHADVDGAAWLKRLDGTGLLAPAETADVVRWWGSTGVRLTDVAARIITARRFNQVCGRGLNKSDLLSETTLELVRHLLDRQAKRVGQVDIYCDRHGGRRYYLSVLQHVFRDGEVAIDCESNRDSVYRIRLGGLEARIRFTVKGDVFTPVALASVHAKYWRECFMDSLNRFFAAAHIGPGELRRTAGYPRDADRFLEETRPIRRRLGIADSDFVRCR